MDTCREVLKLLDTQDDQILLESSLENIAGSLGNVYSSRKPISELF